MVFKRTLQTRGKDLGGQIRDLGDGLTTGAGILRTSAIGMLVGLEKYILAAGTTVIVFVVLRFVNLLEPKDPPSEK
jgi:uncharacterized membrane protein YhiD involved in acid resistance